MTSVFMVALLIALLVFAAVVFVSGIRQSSRARQSVKDERLRGERARFAAERRLQALTQSALDQMLDEARRSSRGQGAGWYDE